MVLPAHAWLAGSGWSCRRPDDDSSPPQGRRSNQPPGQLAPPPYPAPPVQPWVRHPVTPSRGGRRGRRGVDGDQRWPLLPARSVQTGPLPSLPLSPETHRGTRSRQRSRKRVTGSCDNRVPSRRTAGGKLLGKRPPFHPVTRVPVVWPSGATDDPPAFHLLRCWRVPADCHTGVCVCVYVKNPPPMNSKDINWVLSLRHTLSLILRYTFNRTSRPTGGAEEV